MPNLKNQEQVKEISEKLQNSSGVVFVDYKGLTHLQLESLRNSVNETGADLHITKNTLLKVALAGNENLADAAEKSNEHLLGPTATLFLGEEVVAPIKILSDFVKANELPVIKSGIVDNHFTDKEGIEKISKLPSREELISKVMGSLNAPASGLVITLSGVARKLVYALNAVKEQMEGGDTNG